MLKKFPSIKINSTKNPLIFFRELQVITVLLLVSDSYMSWSTRFVSLNMCEGFSIFDSVLYSLKFIFLFKNLDSLTLKRHNSFQNYNNGKATQSFAPRPLIFNLQQEVLKFNDMCMSCSSPKRTWWQIF